MVYSDDNMISVLNGVTNNCDVYPYPLGPKIEIASVLLIQLTILVNVEFLKDHGSQQPLSVIDQHCACVSLILGITSLTDDDEKCKQADRSSLVSRLFSNLRTCMHTFSSRYRTHEY